MQVDLARLSCNSRLTVVEDSGHEIHLFRPDMVVAAIRAVSEAGVGGAGLRRNDSGQASLNGIDGVESPGGRGTTSRPWQVFGGVSMFDTDDDVRSCGPNGLPVAPR